MKKRLLDTATVILDKFINRYHEYYDFWAVGVLYTHCQSLNKFSLTFNLLDNRNFQNDDLLMKINMKFSGYLDCYLMLHHKKRDYLTQATIQIAFDNFNQISEDNLYGDYFQIRVILVDLNNRKFMRRREGYCTPHVQWLERSEYIDSLSIEAKYQIVGSACSPIRLPIKSMDSTDYLFNDNGIPSNRDV